MARDIGNRQKDIARMCRTQKARERLAVPAKIVAGRAGCQYNEHYCKRAVELKIKAA